MVDIPSVFWLINTGVQILVGEIGIFRMQQVYEFEFGSNCYLVNDTPECLYHSRHCDHQDWFQGWCKGWMPLWWNCLYLWKAEGHWILSPQWIPLPFFTHHPAIVTLCHIHPLVKGIPPQNQPRQPHYNFLSQQFTYHCCCHWGESLAKSHLIRHHCSSHIGIPNPPPHNEPYCPNLVCQKHRSGQAGNWILVTWNTGICWLANQMGVQQPDCLIKTLGFKFIVDCIDNSIQYWSRIFWIKDLLTILHLLLNLPSPFLCVVFVLNDLFQLLRCKLDRWAHIQALLKFIPMLGISQRSNHLNESLWMEYNQFTSSIRTYINTCIILLPTILLSLLSATRFRTFQWLCIMINRCAHRALTQIAGITLTGQITCSAIFFPVTLIISTTNIFTLCPSFNLEAFERQQLYEI